MIGSPSEHVLFIDRNSGGRTFRSLIEAHGIVVKLHDEEFERQDTNDEEWLEAIGKRGWIMITGDAKITRAPLFLSILEKTTAQVFILKALNGATPQGKAQCVISHYGRILNISTIQKGPILYRINKDGTLKEIDFTKILARMKRHRRA